MATKSLQRLLGVYRAPAPVVDEEQLIRVNQVIGKAALIYEKFRNAIDYRDEHLLRKNAAWRILKRKLLIEKFLINQTEEKLAEQIIQEMIRAGYLKNNSEPKSKIAKIKGVIEKYHALATRADLKTKEYLWLLEIEACEIDEILAPQDRERALVRFAFEVMNGRIESNRGEIDEREKELQVFIATNRTLLKSDDGILSYGLWRLFYPDWETADDKLLVEIALNFSRIKKEITEQLNHPWKKSLTKIFRRFAVVFWTFQSIIEKDPAAAAAVFDDPVRLELEANKACEARYRDVRRKLSRGVIRSIFYVFFTKTILAILIELPLDQLVSGAVNYVALAVNLAFPPILMFFVAITVRTPGKKNTALVMQEVKQIVSGERGTQKFNLHAPKKRHPLASFILNLLYLAVFAACVYYIMFGLYRVGFTWVSAAIFVFFLSLVSFFGLRIRRPVKEIGIEAKRDNIFTLLIDFFSLPFATVGQYLSIKFSKVNFVAFIFDFIIEAPFKILIEVLEDLFGFWRERKEEEFES
jgi:hypothetical protein